MRRPLIYMYSEVVVYDSWDLGKGSKISLRRFVILLGSVSKIRSTWIFRWKLSTAMKDGTDENIAKYNGREEFYILFLICQTDIKHCWKQYIKMINFPLD